MHFQDPAIRAAYRRGVHDAYHSACIHVPSIQRVAVDEWMRDLVTWKDGQPPEPPHFWAANSNEFPG